MKISLNFEKKPCKEYIEAGVNENKQIKYTRKKNKKSSCQKCVETGDECNSVR